MNRPLEEISTLIKSARAGNHQALSILMGASRAALRKQTEQQLPAGLGARLDASDVLQDVLLEASRDFEGFRGKTSEEWWAWVNRVLANNVVECLRRHIRAEKRSVHKEQAFENLPWENAVKSPSAGSSPSQRAIRNEVAEWLDVNQSLLHPDSQRVLKLRYWEGKSFTQIADDLDLSKSGAARLLRKALLELRHQFSDGEM